MLQNQSGRLAMARRATAVLSMLLFAFLFMGSVSRLAQSQTYKVIHSFTVSDGATPYGGPILDEKGNLYGTTYLGGSEGSGTVYKLSPDGSSWVFKSLYSLKGGGMAPDRHSGRWPCVPTIDCLGPPKAAAVLALPLRYGRPRALPHQPPCRGRRLWFTVSAPAMTVRNRSAE